MIAALALMVFSMMFGVAMTLLIQDYRAWSNK